MNKAQQKAQELVDKFFWKAVKTKEQAKQCAIIAVDELIVQNGELYLLNLGDKTIEHYKKQNAYLFDVKSEIEKL